MGMESACLSVNTGRLCVWKGSEQINVGMYPCGVYMACFDISLGYQALGLREGLMHTIPSPRWGTREEGIWLELE